MCAWIIGFGVTVGHNLRLDSLVERSNETVQVLSNSYAGLFRINFREDTYEVIKGSTYARSQLGREGSYADLIQAVTRLMDSDTANEFCNSFSTESLQKLRAQQIRDYGGDFLGRYPSGDRWINIRVLFDAALGEDEAVLCFREVDQESAGPSRSGSCWKRPWPSPAEREVQAGLLQQYVPRHAHPPERDPGGAGPAAAARRRAGQGAGLCRQDCLFGAAAAGPGERHPGNVPAGQGKVTLSHQAFDLENCIRACADSFTPQARRESKHFELHCEIQDARVMGDATRVTQMLNNILSNAFKFTSEGDSITVSVRQMGGPPATQYQIVVKDTGIGMSEEFLPHLFEPYVRETRFFSRQVVGTGLGMPIVKSLVTQMSGQVYVDSKLGEGTTFTITLPFITAEADAERREHREKAPAGPAKAPEAFSLKGKTILLAEDNVLNMEIASEILSMNGVEVLQAWNGREAVELFRASAPFGIDAILMDMQMPEMDGCEAARRIRAADRPDAPVIPIVAVTANAFAEDIAATTAAGMNAHISKPIRLPCPVRYPGTPAGQGTLRKGEKSVKSLTCPQGLW